MSSCENDTASFFFATGGLAIMQKRNKPNLDRGQIVKENLFKFLPSSGVRWELIVVNMATCDFLFLKIFELLQFFSPKMPLYKIMATVQKFGPKKRHWNLSSKLQAEPIRTKPQNAL